MKRRFSQARQLSFAAWQTLFLAWAALLYFNIILRWRSYEELLDASLFSPKTKKTVHEPEAFHQLVRWAAFLHWLKMTCLPRSLTLHWLLRRHGFDSAVKIGAQKKATGLLIHAWVEIDGKPVDEDTNAFDVLLPSTR